MKGYSHLDDYTENDLLALSKAGIKGGEAGKILKDKLPIIFEPNPPPPLSMDIQTMEMKKKSQTI